MSGWRGRAPEELTQEILRFATAAQVPNGFGWLDDHGQVDHASGLQLWITSRMTHVYATASVNAAHWSAYAEHGVAALLDGELYDSAHGGWRSRVAEPDGDARKSAYDHTFVVLAGASAARAGVVGGEALLGRALEVWDEHFWDATTDSINESFAADWSNPEPYRGANAHMHGVEALLAAYSAAGHATGDATGGERRLLAARRICERLILGLAADHGWRLPEHYTTSWEPVLDYNRDSPADRFRPFGVTIGHLFEWARLCVELADRLGEGAASRHFVAAAEGLYRQAVADGWARDGYEGFVYTVDFAGVPVVTKRLHWVVTEAIAAAAALGHATGRGSYAVDWQRFTDHAVDWFVDPVGSWHHELNAQLEPEPGTWHGKPDIYHSFGALTCRSPFRVE